MSPRALLLLFAFALPARAAPFACPALTHVGISDLGYLSYQENGANHGAAVDIVAELSKRTGCRFNVEWYPRGRMFVQLSNGQLDLAMSALRSPERDRAGSWIPYSYTQFQLLLTSEGGGPFSSLEEFVDRSKARLNVTRGITYPPAANAQLERLEKQGRLEYVNDYAIVFRKIKAGRAEGTLAPPVIYLQHQRRLGMVGLLKAMSIAEWPRSLTGVYISHATVSGTVRQGLSATFYDMVNDGTVQKIYERYLGPEVTREVFAGGMREILDAYPR